MSIKSKKQKRKNVTPDGDSLQNVPNRLKPMIKTYKNTLFSGKIGELKNHEVKFHIDKNVPPIAQIERRIPFALSEKVKTEIEKLENEHIIEDVTGQPTPWLPPGSSIRLCLDTAITRTRYPTPTVDDLLIKLRGATRFSKLDLKSAFH